MASPVGRNSAFAVEGAAGGAAAAHGGQPAQTQETADVFRENARNRMPLALQQNTLRIYIPYLIRIINMCDPTLTDEAIHTLTVIQAIFIARVHLLFCGERGSHKITNEALLSFFSHEFYKEPSPESFEKMYNEFWQTCGIPEQQRASLSSMAKVVGNLAACLDVFDTTLGPKTANFLSSRQQMLQALAKLNEKILQLLLGYWIDLHEKMHGLLRYFKCLEDSIRELKQSIRLGPEALKKGVTIGHVGAGHKVLIEMSTSFIKTLPEAVNGVRRLAPYLVTFDLNNMSGSRRVHSMLGYLNRLIKTASIVEGEAKKYEVFMCLNLGVYPKSRLGKVYVVASLLNIENLVGNFIHSDCITATGKALEGTDSRERIIQKVVQFFIQQIDKGLTPIDLKGSKEKKAFANSWNNAVKVINEKVLKSFYHVTKIQEEYTRDMLASRIKGMLEAIEHTAKDCGHSYSSAVNVVCDFLQTRAKSHQTEEGLKKELNKIRESTLKDRIAYNDNVKRDDSHLNRVAKLQYQATSYFTSFDLFTFLLKALKEGEAQLKKELDANALVIADDALDLLNLEEEHNARIANMAYAKMLADQKERKDKEVIAAPAASTSAVLALSAAAETAAASVTAAVVPNAFVPRPVVESSFKTSLSEHVFDLRHCVSLFHGINPADNPVLPVDVENQELPLSQLALQRHLYWLDSFAVSLQLYQHCESPLERVAARNQLILSAYIAAEQAAVTVFGQRYPYRLLQHDLAMLLKKIDIDLPNNFLMQHGNSATYYLRYPKCHRVSRAYGTPFLLQCMLERSPKVAKEFHQQLPQLVDAVVKISVAVLEASPQASQHQILLEHMRKVFMQTMVIDMDRQQREIIETPLSKEDGEKLGKCQRDLEVGISLLEKKMAAERANVRAKNELHHALNRLIDIRGTVGLFAAMPLQSFLWRHLHHLIFSTQYFSENLGTFLSIKREEEVRKHSLAMYCREYGLDKGLSEDQKALVNLLDISKGSEYLYGWEETAKEGLIGKLGQLYARAKEALILGEGARTVRPGGVDRTLQQLQGDVVDWVVKFVDLTLALQRLHL